MIPPAGVVAVTFCEVEIELKTVELTPGSQITLTFTPRVVAALIAVITPKLLSML